MKSIMHEKGRHCYLCALLHDDFSVKNDLQEHHVIYGNGRRALSEKYGLKVYLCFKHHTYAGGPEAIHRDSEIALIVKKAAQLAFMYRFPELNFREIFGKSYLEENEIAGRRRDEQSNIDGTFNKRS